jgi:LysM repeat protein
MNKNNNQIIKIGLTEVKYTNFVQAVKESEKISDVCYNLGLNGTVQTTRNNVKAAIEELNLDINHFKYIYHKSELNNKPEKEYELSVVNKLYYDAFKESLTKSSFTQYKVNIGDFLEKLSATNIDFANIKIKQIEDYANSKQGNEATKKNCMAHLRSLLIFIVKNNINNAMKRVSKEMLIWLIVNK